MKLISAIFLNNLFGDKLGLFFATIYGKILIWMILVFIFLSLLSWVIISKAEHMKKYNVIKLSKGYDVYSKYSLINYIIGILIKCFKRNIKVIILLFCILLIFLSIILYGVKEGAF